MTWMNEFEIDNAVQRYADDAVLGPASQTLSNLRDWTNANSDGWPYWTKPSRAAVKLQEMLTQAERAWRSGETPDISPADYAKALRPIKSFRTRVGGDFKIIEAAASKEMNA